MQELHKFSGPVRMLTCRTQLSRSLTNSSATPYRNKAGRSYPFLMKEYDGGCPKDCPFLGTLNLRGWGCPKVTTASSNGSYSQPS